MLRKTDELTRLSPMARDGIDAAIQALHRLGLPHLAGHLFPVIHPDFPASEVDALTRIETLRILLRAKPLVVAVVGPLLACAETQLYHDLNQEQVAV